MTVQIITGGFRQAREMIALSVACGAQAMRAAIILRLRRNCGRSLAHARFAHEKPRAFVRSGS